MDQQTPSSNQEASNVMALQLLVAQFLCFAAQIGSPSFSQTDETSSGDVDEVLMPSTTLDVTTCKGDIDQVATLAKPQAKTPQPIASSSAVLMVLR